MFYYQNPITLGYSPYFTVTHRYKNKDGKMENIFLSTGYLKAHRADILFSFDYKKGTVFIFRDKLYNSNLDSCINWFGQLIYIKAVKGTIAFYYECNEKTESKLLPLNPTRKEIIQNSAYEEFINSIVDNLIDFINIKLFLSINKVKAKEKLGVLEGIIRLLKNLNKDKDIERIKFVAVTNCRTNNIEFLLKESILEDNIIIFKNEEIAVIDNDTETIYPEMFTNLEYFLADIPNYIPIYKYYYGIYTHIAKLGDEYFKQIVWFCGENLEKEYKDIYISFRHLGRFLICSSEIDIQAYFQEKYPISNLFQSAIYSAPLINTSKVLAYETDPSYEDLEESNVYLGVKDDEISTLMNSIDYLIELYNPDVFYEEEGGESNSVSYFQENVIDPIKRTILGNAIKPDFTLLDLKLAVRDDQFELFSNINITNVEYIYSMGNILRNIRVRFTYLENKEWENLVNTYEKTFSIY
jgi:hypothetical protein